MEDLVGGLLGAILDERWRMRRALRSAERGVLPSSLRRHGVGKWEHGQSIVKPGVLSFRKTAIRGGFRMWRPGPWRSISVTGANLNGRKPTGREAWGVHPAATIYALETSEGTIDWAILAPEPDKIVKELDPQA